MTAEQMFSIANAVALLSWLLLAALPRRRRVTDMVTGVVVPAMLATVYVVLIVSHWGAPGGFTSLAAVSTLFSNPSLLLAGWVHYLAFDLLIGTWEVTDAREHGVPHLLVLPCLFLTFMFGPAGWLLYQGVRRAYRRRST